MLRPPLAPPHTAHHTLRLLLLLVVVRTASATISLLQQPAPSSRHIEITLGVRLPFANIGGVHSFPSNYSLWLDLGGRGLDTALIYDHSDHDVQWHVGEAVRTSALQRDQIFVTTKVPCCPAKGVFVQGFDADGWCQKNGYYSGSQTIADSVEHDLSQLQMPFVDLLLLHWPCGTVKQTVAAYRQLEPFVHSGKARAIGVSNMNASMLDAIIKGGTIPPAVNQCGMSVGAHNSSTFGSDRTTLERCRDRGVTYQAYSPLGGLSGVDILRNPTVEAVAARHHASTATVALRWLVQQGVPFVTSSTKAGYDLEDLSTRVVGNRSGALWLSDAEMALLATV